MSKYLVEETYAAALFRLGESREDRDQFLEELLLIAETFQQHPKYFDLLKNPRLGKPEKKELVKELFQENISSILMNFLFVLFDKRRIGAFPGIVKHYRTMLFEEEQLSEGLIVTAAPLEEEQLKRAEREISRLMRKAIRLKNKVDPAIIGGMKIYVDEQIIDASVRNRLKAMESNLKDISI